MPLMMTRAPAIEPVTVAEAAEFLRVDDSGDDVLISTLLLTSRLHIEAALSLALITQAWMLTLDAWPTAKGVTLPLSPLQAVEEVRVRSALGVASVVSPLTYLVDLAARPARIVWNNALPPIVGLPSKGIEIDLTAGFGTTADSVPAPLKHAILMLTAHWYEHRDPGEIGSDGARIPDAVTELIQPYRTMRL